MRRTLVLALLLLLAGGPLFAEVVTRGPHYGQPRIDRWGHPLLQLGGPAFILSEQVWEELQGLAGTLTAVEIDGMAFDRIEEIGRAGEAVTSTGLEIHVESSWVRPGEGLLVTLLVHNQSEPPIWWPPQSLALWVVLSEEAGDELMAATQGSGSADDPWHALGQPDRFGASWFDLWGDGEPVAYAAFEVPIEWNQIELGHLDPCGFPRLPPGYTVIDEVVIGEDLPPGEYEVFAFWRMPHPSGARYGPISNVVPFDVWQP